MTRNGLVIFITSILIGVIVVILLVYNNPGIIFSDFDIIGTGYKYYDLEKNYLISIYNTILYVLSFIFCSCLLSLSIIYSNLKE